MVQIIFSYDGEPLAIIQLGGALGQGLVLGPGHNNRNRKPSLGLESIAIGLMIYS